MKLILSLLLWSGLGIAQTTFTLPSVSAGEPSLSVTVSATAISNLTAWILSTSPGSGWPNSTGIPLTSSLASDVSSTGATTVTLASATNLKTCNGLLIDSEVMAVVSIAGNVVTIVRGSVGTSAATHTSGTQASVLRAGNYTCMLKVFWADGIAGVVNAKLQGAAVTVQTAAIASAQASIAATVASAVQ